MRSGYLNNQSMDMMQQLLTHGGISAMTWRNNDAILNVYCSPVLRHPAGLIQAANFRSAIAF